MTPMEPIEEIVSELDAIKLALRDIRDILQGLINDRPA